MTVSKPRVRFLLPVWGERYIQRFAELSLPSLLAPGNLPSLAAQCDCEIVLLTTADAMAIFEKQPAFAHLKAIAPIRIVPIDDLIVNEYSGVTLSLVYFRGVHDAGDDMVNIYFVFLNSDIILSDGSLGSVGRRIVNGEHCILANSVRAVSEDVEAPLRAMVDPGTHRLIGASRKLVGMALAALHPTTIAKIVNDDLCHSMHVNQFYWRVDRNTLLSRHFLNFMICIRPERVVTVIRGFCDYFFVPEMVPSGKATALEDSDEFFALEIQLKRSEADFLKLGKPSPDEVAASLARWTTSVHRRDAQNHTLVFHAEELPSNMVQVEAEADAYIKDLVSRLPEPQPHIDHPYWTGSYALYEKAKARQSGIVEVELPAPPPVVSPPAATPAAPPPPSLLKGLVGGAKRRVRRLVVGAPPYLPIWHPDWLDYRLAAPIVTRCVKAPGARAMYFKGSSGLYSDALASAEIRPLEQLLDGSFATSASPTAYSFVLVELSHAALPQVSHAVKQLRPFLAADAELLFIYKDLTPGLANLPLDDELMQFIGDFWPGVQYQSEFWFAGGVRKRRLKEALESAAKMQVRYGRYSVPAVVLVTAAVFATCTVNNWRMRTIQDRRSPVERCSSIALHIMTRRA